MMMRKQITLTKIVFASSWHSVLHIGFSKPHFLALRTKSISRSIKVNTNNKKLFMFFPLERKNFRLSAFRGIRLFAHVLIFFVRKHFSKTPGISISPDSCYT